MDREREVISDQELDELLLLTRAPTTPLGAKSRLMRKLNAGVVTRDPASHPSRSWVGWMSAVPLAASLLMGVYLGRSADSESILPASAYELLAGVNAEDPVTGIEDAETLMGGDLT